MTPNERLQRYFAGEEIDHIPYGLIAPDDALCEIYGYTTSQMYNDIHIYQDILRKKRENFGFDDIFVGLGLRTLGGAMGSSLINPEHGLERMENHVLQDYDDWAKLIDPDPYNNKILTPLLEKAQKFKEQMPDFSLSTGVAGPFTTAIAIRPVEKILRDTRKNPEKLKELLALAVDNSLRWVEAFTKEIGPSPCFISDPVTSTEILSPKQFAEFSYPELKRLVSGIKSITGFSPSIHICGHTKAIWPYIKELDLSSFSVDNCEDLAETCAALGDKFLIVGNVPPVEVLQAGSTEDVINSVKDCIRKGATSPKGYIISSGCQVPMGTPKKNLEAYIKAVQKYGKDVKIGELPKGLDGE